MKEELKIQVDGQTSKPCICLPSPVFQISRSKAAMSGCVRPEQPFHQTEEYACTAEHISEPHAASCLRYFTHRPQSSSFWGFIFRILQGNPKKELLWGVWASASSVSPGSIASLRHEGSCQHPFFQVACGSGLAQPENGPCSRILLFHRETRRFPVR